VTIHHITDKFQRNDFVLDAVPLENHTGLDIAQAIQNTLEANGFESKKVVCLVRDDAKNMQRTAHVLEVNRLRKITRIYQMMKKLAAIKA
jgi:hypothetical protein